MPGRSVSIKIREIKCGQGGGAFVNPSKELFETSDWWVASTLCPLVAAAVGPLANLMSIAAIVTKWINEIVESDSETGQDQIGINDPRWCTALNVTSLVCGITGNLFLLFNFTQAVRYAISHPASILLCYLASGILVGITVAMNELEAPIRPNQVYSQGYWHAVIAAVLYFFQSSILLINLLGYILGHYPQNFALTDDERTLILQTMLMSIWLGVGGVIFHTTMDISFTDALYFSDVTVLTVGFGDFAPDNNLSRGLDIPYAVIGIIILGLVVGSIHRIGRDLKFRHIIRRHFERQRAVTFERSATLPQQRKWNDGRRLGFQDPHGGHSIFGGKRSSPKSRSKDDPGWRQTYPISAIVNLVRRVRAKHPNELQLLNHEDRFNAMRSIQKETSRFRRTNALVIRSIAFAVVWFGGAAVFGALESITYFEALYFTFCTLITVGYGDISPSTNAAKPFFIVWSLLAVSIVTTLVSEMADTVIAGFQRVSVTIGDWSVLPKRGAVTILTRIILRLLSFLRLRRTRKASTQEFAVDPDQESARQPRPNLKPLPSLSNHELSKQVVSAIRKAADDLKNNPGKHYTYDEWRHFTYLIQFTTSPARGFNHDREESTVVDWDWLGESSPMVTGQSEPQWVINRLSESMVRHLDHVHWRLDTERQPQSQSRLEASSAQQGSSETTDSSEDER